jgi:hypothetical protein
MAFSASISASGRVMSPLKPPTMLAGGHALRRAVLGPRHQGGDTEANSGAQDAATPPHPTGVRGFFGI